MRRKSLRRLPIDLCPRGAMSNNVSHEELKSLAVRRVE